MSIIVIKKLCEFLVWKSPKQLKSFLNKVWSAKLILYIRIKEMLSFLIKFKTFVLIWISENPDF